MKTKLTSTIVAIITCAIATAEPPKGEGKKGARGAGPRPVPQPSAEMIKKYDKDGDGKLSQEERKAAMEGRRAEMMKKYDKDGDGKLSQEERKASMADRRAEMMKKFDKDGDGKLSEEERAAARKSMGARRGGARGAGKGEDGRKKGKGAPKKGKKPAAK